MTMVNQRKVMPVCGGWTDTNVRIIDGNTGASICTCTTGSVYANGKVVNAQVNGDKVVVVCEKRTLLFNASNGGLIRALN